MPKQRGSSESARATRSRTSNAEKENKIESAKVQSKATIKTEKPQETKATRFTNPVPAKSFPKSTALLINNLRCHQRHPILIGQARIQLVSDCILPSLRHIPISIPHVQSPRIMSMEWHPNNPNILLVGGKYGEIYLINDFEMALPEFEKVPGSKNVIINEGVGKAGGITTIKFDLFDDKTFYTSNIRGQVAVNDLNGSKTVTLFQTDRIRQFCLDHWFTALDVNCHRKVLLVGDNKGGLHTMPIDGRGQFVSFKAHRSKIHSVDFHPVDSNIFATCSLDNFVKIWDIRQLKRDDEFCGDPLKTIDTEKALQSSIFSRTNGGTLAVSDQKDTIFIYSTSSWELLRTIQHHQAHFQHLTPIRPSWHPLADILVVGRYKGGDRVNSNQIDFYDTHTGQSVFSIDPEPRDLQGIKSLNTFNCTGDTLASGLGTKILIWKTKSFVDGLRDKCLKNNKKKSTGDHGHSDGSDSDDDYLLPKYRMPKRVKRDAPKKK